jgi:hypothetical protein
LLRYITNRLTHGVGRTKNPSRDQKPDGSWKDTDPDPDIPILKQAKAEYPKLQ